MYIDEHTLLEYHKDGTSKYLLGAWCGGTSCWMTYKPMTCPSIVFSDSGVWSGDSTVSPG